MISSIINPTSYLIGAGLKRIFESVYESDNSTPLATLKEEALRAEIKAKTRLAEAKVEQELAIARRIDGAEEVEIEEFYDTSGKGSAGLSAEGESVSVGLSGEGRKITKRVIKFRGCAPVIQPDEPDSTMQLK